MEYYLLASPSIGGVVGAVEVVIAHQGQLHLNEEYDFTLQRDPAGRLHTVVTQVSP